MTQYNTLYGAWQEKQYLCKTKHAYKRYQWETRPVWLQEVKKGRGGLISTVLVPEFVRPQLKKYNYIALVVTKYSRGARPNTRSSFFWHRGPVQLPTHLHIFQDVVEFSTSVVLFLRMQVPLFAHSPVSHGQPNTTFWRSALTSLLFLSSRSK